MATGFFVDVLEVESVDTRKSREGREVVYARLRLAGGTLAVKVRDGLKIQSGYTGKASGTVRVSSLKREFNGRFSDVVALLPVEIDTWIPGQLVASPNISAMESFLKK